MPFVTYGPQGVGIVADGKVIPTWDKTLVIETESEPSVGANKPKN